LSTVPQLREDDTTRQSLERWLSAQWCVDVTVSELARPQTAGGSNETLLTTVSWTEQDEPRSREVVIRVAPTAMTVFLDARFEQQYRVLETLGRSTDIPVPEMMGFEPDESLLGSPFWVMSRIHGQAPSDFPHITNKGSSLTPAPRSENASGTMLLRPWLPFTACRQRTLTSSANLTEARVASTRC
jgi:aminoglycoside phosphotransferase (APT) family kinase protein